LTFHVIDKKRTNVILGIDPGIADTGYGLIRDCGGRLECLAYGSIKTNPKQGLPERLLRLSEGLEKVIREYKPAKAAVESLFFCNNAKTAIAVGQARGVVIMTLKQAGLPITEFTPLQVKQAVACYGQATKTQVQRMVKTILGLKELPKPDDAADALAVAICGLNTLGCDS
jgi:crossover junction endodeoxyribonuclease RuvC